MTMQYRSILLIDDDEDDQELFQLALGDVARDVQCKVLTSAKEALHHLETGLGTIDLIFLDLNMPIMTGQQFLAELKERQLLDEIPVIVLSTSSDATIVKQARSLGARKFITKPSNFQELKDILHNILA